MQLKTYPAGTDIIVQGDVDGQLFYVIEEGQCDIFVEGVGRVMQVSCTLGPEPAP
jgi:cAMP-dependent protein kinase regulator